MRYFKIITGYGAEDYTEIDETELEKAYYCHLTKKDAIFSGGSVSGSEIKHVRPDYHRAMGWNRGYKLTSEDYAELSSKGIDRAHTHLLSEKKDKVQYLLETNQIALIGKNVDIALPERKDVTVEVETLANKMKIK